jgi:hypothetical protein
MSPSDILRGKVLIVDEQGVNAALLERILLGAGSSRIFPRYLREDRRIDGLGRAAQWGPLTPARPT